MRSPIALDRFKFPSILPSPGVTLWPAFIILAFSFLNLGNSILDERSEGWYKLYITLGFPEHSIFLAVHAVMYKYKL